MEELHQARTDEHRARAWQHRMAAFKELTISLLMVMFMVLTYSVATKVWPFLPR